MALQPKNKKK